jgi:hypothetical protein
MQSENLKVGIQGIYGCWFWINRAKTTVIHTNCWSESHNSPICQQWICDVAYSARQWQTPEWTYCGSSAAGSSASIGLGQVLYSISVNRTSVGYFLARPCYKLPARLGRLPAGPGFRLKPPNRGLPPCYTRRVKTSYDSAGPLCSDWTSALRLMAKPRESGFGQGQWIGVNPESTYSRARRI